ncbi:MAG TPA: hypothetical protein DCO77_06320 [Nitrospiraceae bacterium]|nr:hypothetical protein [Nitrospiraceae bacterium]
MKKLLVLVPILFFLALAGCSKDSDNVVVAKVNRTKITIGDFQKQVADLPPQLKQAVAVDPKARQDFLDDLIGIEVVLQEARRQGLHKDEEFVKKQKLFKQEMERRLEEQMKNELFNGLFKKELAGKITPPTDKEVKAYYNEHKKEMRTADGKRMSLKDAAPQLKAWLLQKKQREAYMEYAKELKAKAKITIDEKAMGTLGKSLSEPDGSDLLQEQAPNLQDRTAE